ncbi:Hsp33 family molecular chaperone HslO [Enterococcus aquimarinus]|uniref:33 kDa chaperonin n=1 Tax=Enterococcus aquimarinus TaxID=328396 RepID=A0A1L8QU51_9ENTE|nr:Hsp33 family molecular chaperone HslO [Enterococcus aquimarinus]OJG11039.1 hsp33-like protein [Enterococcus aquimarinus]
MNDYLTKALVYGGSIRAYALNATKTVSEAQKRHETWHTSSAALGRALIGTLLLSNSSLKNDDRLTVKIQGDGPAGAIIIDGDAKGNVKGYIQNPHVSLDSNEYGKIDVRGAVGTQGIFTVIKDLGLKEPFSGQVPIVSGELGEDFTYYLAASEQIPSAVGLSVLVDKDESIKAAGGFMIQVMPGASEEVIGNLEEKLAKMPPISDLIAAGNTPEEILELIFEGESIMFLEEMPVQFTCDCSKEKFSKAMITLGYQELQAMIDEDHGAEAVCSFCNEKYQFDEAGLVALQQEITGGNE